MENDEFFYNDKTSSCEELLSKDGFVSIHHKNLQNVSKL